MVKNASDRWAVLIGINGYHESLGRLKYSVNDCRRLAEVLTTGDDAFPADHVLVLADDEAAERKPTYANIHSWLASWLAQPDEDDTVLVFFAGHGREMDGKCYLVPGDATLQTIHVTGIPVPFIQELLNRCKARQKVLILDACHSGAGRDVSTMVAPMMETLSAGKGIYTLTSCDVDELSHEWDEKSQGVFSYYLAEALSGSCPPDAHGHLTADGVYEWVFDQVRGWSRTHRCSQSPRRICDMSGTVSLMRPKPNTLRCSPGVDKHEVDTTRDFKLQENSEAIPTVAHKNVLEDTGRWGEFRTVISPPGETVVFLLDDEPAGISVKKGWLPGGKHTLKVIPESYRFGVRTFKINVVPGQALRKVVCLRSVLHGRVIGSLMLLLAFGAAVGSLAMVLPQQALWGIPAKHGQGNALINNLQDSWWLAGCWVVGIAYGGVLALLMWAVRRASSPIMLAFAVLCPVPLLYVASMLSFVASGPSAAGFAIGAATLVGIVGCVVPWPTYHYHDREMW